MSEKELSKNMSMLFKASWAVAALAVAMIAIVMKPDTFSFLFVIPEIRNFL